MSVLEEGNAGDCLHLGLEELNIYQGEEVNRIRAAGELASVAHEGQLRASGEPYMVHPISVGRIEVAWETTSPKQTFDFRIVAGESPHVFAEIEGGLRKVGAHLIAGKLEDGEISGRRGRFTVEVEPGTDRFTLLKNINAIPTVHRIEVV